MKPIFKQTQTVAIKPDYEANMCHKHIHIGNQAYMVPIKINKIIVLHLTQIIYSLLTVQVSKINFDCY
jgi:hypothetical protein